MNIPLIIDYLAAQQGIEEVDFGGGDVEVRDEGNGAFIAKWNLPFPQPTEDELVEAEAAALTEAAKYAYIPLRVASYPPLGDQLDMLYKDLMNGTDDWCDLITYIKTQYPKG